MSLATLFAYPRALAHHPCFNMSIHPLFIALETTIYSSPWTPENSTSLSILPIAPGAFMQEFLQGGFLVGVWWGHRDCGLLLQCGTNSWSHL